MWWAQWPKGKKQTWSWMWSCIMMFLETTKIGNKTKKLSTWSKPHTTNSQRDNLKQVWFFSNQSIYVGNYATQTSRTHHSTLVGLLGHISLEILMIELIVQCQEFTNDDKISSRKKNCAQIWISSGSSC